MLAKVAAILSALNETNGIPESMFYIFLDMNMDLWERVRDLLIRQKLITIRGNYVMLTELGKDTARRIDSVNTDGREICSEMNRAKPNMTTCKKCGKPTGPAFGLCSSCIKKEDAKAKS